MWLTAEELKLVIDGLSSLMRRHHSGSSAYKKAKKLRSEFQDKYARIPLLDIDKSTRRIS